MIMLIYVTKEPYSRRLFSKAQQRVLALFFGRPDEAFHVNQVIRDSGLGTASVQRDFARLEASRLIASERTGNRVSIAQITRALFCVERIEK
jgi:hypothetical protein